MKTGTGHPAADADLAKAARQGDKRAFVEIVARHQAMVCGIAYGILADFAASEDAAQEAFLTAWRKIHDLRQPESLRAWLSQITRNAALGHLRRRHPERSLDEALETADTALHPDEAAASDEEAALVREALTKLPETFRLPLVLFYRDGQSVKHVAEALELSEDAVKQRLARGREMLRERMSGLIETVLTRTRPTAIFTMVIAAAIGALAAPAAIAGTAFAAASTAAASTTASAAGSVATAMSTSKTSLTIAALVAAACLPLGYGARMGMESGPPDAAAAKNMKSAVKDAPQAKLPDFKDSALFAEWRKLHEEHGATPDAMPALYKAISEIKDPLRRRVFRAAQIAEWAEIAPETGLAFFLQDGRDSGQRGQFFNEWLLRDAPAAVNALLNSKAGWESMARHALVEIAKRVPDRIGEITARLPKSDSYWSNEIRDAFAIVAAGNLASARAAAEALTGDSREQALTGVARAWAKTDINAAIAWAKSLPDGVDRDEIIRGALVGLSSTKPVEALDKMNAVPPGGRQGYFATSTGARILKEAAATDYDATVAWLAAHPANAGHEDMMGMADVVTNRLNADPVAFLKRHAADGSLSVLMPAIGSAVLNQAGGQRAAIWDWMKTQPDSEAIQKLRHEIINSAGYQDPALAMKLVGDTPKTAAGDETVGRIASSLLNGGQGMGRFESYMAAAPERLRQPLLESAFNCLNPENLDDPQAWIGRLSQVREENRASTTARLASSWAAQSPEEAVAWVATLPEGDTRNAAVGSAAGAWVHKDAFGASEWITTLPAGPGKDNAAGALIREIAAESPAEAWQWALSIGDPATRLSNAMFTLDTLQKRDPAAARQWLDAASFTVQERDHMRTALENHTGSATPPAR